MSASHPDRLRSLVDDEAHVALEHLHPGVMEADPTTFRKVVDLFAVDVIKGVAIDAVQRANSGHPGGPCSSVDFAHVLFTRHLKASSDPGWLDRDRFVLSGGHMSMLLYALLHLQGRLSYEDLLTFRQMGSPTQGHPVYRFAPGIECTTGPLGQGFASGVGLAMAESWLSRVLGDDLLGHHTWVLATDGDIQEGVCREAASLAGHLGLGRLNVFYDANDIQLASPVQETMTEDVAMAFRAKGWHVLELPDGHDHEALHGALHAARAETRRPSLVIGKTIIARGTRKAGSVASHGSPLGRDVIEEYKRDRRHPTDRALWIPEVVREVFRERLAAMDGEQARWTARVEAARRTDPGRARLLDDCLAPCSDRIPADLREALDRLQFPSGKDVATRTTGGAVMAALAGIRPPLLGGSADLANSTKTDTFEKEVGAFLRDVTPGTLRGRGLSYGVREHAMGAITNGIALHGGLLPYSGTFLAFSDYMRPAIRLAAISKLPSVFIFTHDSIFLGEDGETHQPVEHLEALRVIPGLLVIRPGDAHETLAAWERIVTLATGPEPRPVCLILSRQNLPVLDETREKAREGMRSGAYAVVDGPEPPRVQIVATGSELHLAVGAARELTRRHGWPVRVVSMPCQELFLELPPGERDRILHPGPCLNVAVEAGVGKGWPSILGELGRVLSIETFGESAPHEQLMEKHGFTVDRLTAWIEDHAATHPGRVARRAREDMEWLRANHPALIEG